MRFFEPTPAFFRWIRKSDKLRWRPWRDLGAGEGHVTEQLVKNGILCTAYDIYPDQAEYAVLGRDVLDWDLWVDRSAEPYEIADVVAFCARPCHDGAWVKTVLEDRAYAQGATAFYIGLDRNLGKDLGEERPHWKMVLDKAGKEGERVWHYAPHRNDAIANKKRPTFDDNPGWLMPDGTYISCQYDYANPWSGHKKALREDLGISEKWSEHIGCVRLNGFNDERNPWFMPGKWLVQDAIQPTPNPAQRRALKKLGYVLED